MREPLQEYAQKPLAWERLLDLLRPYAASSLGRAWAATLAPSADLGWIEREHGLVAEMRLLLAEGVRPSLAGLEEPAQMLAKARLTGAALEPVEIRTLLILARAVTEWAGTMRNPPDRFRDSGLEKLVELTEPILDVNLTALVEGIGAKLLPDGQLVDSASPELERLRREIDRQQRAIEESLRGALRRLSEEGSAQEGLITIRGDRFVIPVKAEAKRRVAGVVHGSSGSGQTVYLEPLETLDLNNDLQRLFGEEQEEIHQIFLQMTAQIAAQAEVLSQGARVLAVVETLVMRGRFAEEFDCVRPRFVAGPGAEIRLIGARHPLLEHRLRQKRREAPFRADRTEAGDRVAEERAGKQPEPPEPASVVPLSLALEPDRRQLIISGPNTGGKTVGLKTTGLLAMMAQAGIPVPAVEATLPVLTAVLADIGDAQSIEQNLSTFSAHITNLNRLAELVGPGTLVLIDELGSATDPEEGAALAVAIAEHFLQAGGWSIISTHHTSLKVYGETTPGVGNAAVGFDAETLAPTYELRQGVPGASAGLNIAARLGLSPVIIESARGRMSSQALDIGAFLDRLHAEIGSLGEERLRVQAQEKALKAERHRLEVEGAQEMRARVRELENELNATLRELDGKAKEAVQGIEDRAARVATQAEAERRAAQLRREFSERFTAQVRQRKPNAMQQAAAQVAARIKDPRLAAVGDLVKLRIGQQGRVSRELDASTVEVAIGSMKMRVRRGDIAAVLQAGSGPAPVSPTPVESARGRGVTVRTSRDTEDELGGRVQTEINVIGLTADQAGDDVERFIDQAFLSGLQRVRVVHGTGMGVLRRTLRASLQKHPHVAGVMEADQYEGGQGATIVELRQ